MRLSLPLLTAWPDADAGGSTPHIPRAEKPFNVGIIHSDVHVIGGVGVGAGLQAPPCRLPHRPHSVVKERVAWPPSRRLGSPRRVQTAQDPGTSLHFYTFTSFDSLIDDFLRTRAPSGRVTRVIRWQTPSRSAEDPLPEGQRPEERAWCLPPGGHEPGSSAGRRRGSPRPEGLLVDPVKEDGLCVSSGEQRENARAKGQKPAPGLREKRRWRHGGGGLGNRGNRPHAGIFPRVRWRGLGRRLRGRTRAFTVHPHACGRGAPGGALGPPSLTGPRWRSCSGPPRHSSTSCWTQSSSTGGGRCRSARSASSPSP